ncbi:hypothetical protein D6779_08720 [Candidatus Parcubacteria bacterium]|nr:MAG: hypothetical protein D6779_08720 [Candidatus Parcubacteria bacterium]
MKFTVVLGVCSTNKMTRTRLERCLRYWRGISITPFLIVVRNSTACIIHLCFLNRLWTIAAQRPALHLRREAQRSGVRCKRVLCRLWA